MGGMGTENKSWGTFAGDMRHWLDDRIQTLVGTAYLSVKLDFHGLGENSVLKDNPVRYTLEPAAFALRGRYRFGDTLFWAGASYAFATTEVLVDTPDDIPPIPDYDKRSRVGGLTPSATYDSRHSMFTPTRGSYVEASCGVFGKALALPGRRSCAVRNRTPLAILGPPQSARLRRGGQRLERLRARRQPRERFVRRYRAAL